MTVVLDKKVAFIITGRGVSWFGSGSNKCDWMRTAVCGGGQLNILKLIQLERGEFNTLASRHCGEKFVGKLYFQLILAEL